jgi:hypothetical protein
MLQTNTLAVRPADAQARQTTPQRPQRLRAWLVAAACCTSLGVAHADSSSELATVVQPADDGQTSAVMGQAADVGSTGAGLLMGAAEANPLGLVTLGIKAVAYQKIKSSPPVEQPRLWGMYGAMGWGATANNLCVIATIATGGSAAVLCPLLGLGAGMGSWNAGSEERDRATFAAICDQAKVTNPKLVCIYNGSNS